MVKYMKIINKYQLASPGKWRDFFHFLALSTILLFAVFGLAEISNGATINAASCSIGDINAAIGFASAGDTVSVPAGDCSWDASATKVNLNKAITLRGAGIDLTNITITKVAASYSEAIYASVNSYRITAFTFATSDYTTEAIKAYGNDWRIDHCKFIGFYYCIDMQRGLNSLIDSNQFYGTHMTAGSGAGTATWGEDTGLGGNQFIFVENNTFSDIGALTLNQRVFNANSGTKLVLRYNDVKIENPDISKRYIELFDAHGYCYAPDLNQGRSTRAYEIYNNKVTESTAYYCSDGVHISGGTGVIYNNQFGCNSFGRGVPVYFFNWRSPGADWESTGASSCYAASPNTSGKNYCSSDIYKVSTTDAGSKYAACNGAPAPSSGKWCSTSTFVGQDSGASAVVVGSDNSDSLFFNLITNGPFQDGENLLVNGSVVTVAVGNSTAYSGEGYPCVDQVGRGRDQSSEPVYVWGNVDKNGNAFTTPVGTTAKTGYITQEVDYYLSVKPGYSPYACPHPLTGYTGSCDSSLSGTSGYNVMNQDTTPPAAPSGLVVK